MMTTLGTVATRKKEGEPTAEEAAAVESVRIAQEQGVSLTGPDGLLEQFTRTVLGTALNEEPTEHLGHGSTERPRIATAGTSATGRAG